MPTTFRGAIQRSGCALIKQRLEQVIVLPVDQRDGNVRAAKRTCDLDARKPCADDDDAVSFRNRHDEDQSNLSSPASIVRYAHDAREGDPGGEAGHALSTWVPFPSQHFVLLGRE